MEQVRSGPVPSIYSFYHPGSSSVYFCCFRQAKPCLTVAPTWTVARQAPLPVGFLRQECWSGLSFPSLGNFPNPGIEPRSPALADGYHWATRETPASVCSSIKCGERSYPIGFLWGCKAYVSVLYMRPTYITHSWLLGLASCRQTLAEPNSGFFTFLLPELSPVMFQAD